MTRSHPIPIGRLSRAVVSAGLMICASVLPSITVGSVYSASHGPALAHTTLTWQAPYRVRTMPWTGVAIRGISCAGVHFCEAVDAVGNLLTTVHPREGASAWVAHDFSPGGIGGISCPSATFCVMAGSGNLIRTSTNPAARHPVWRVTHVSHGTYLGLISCASPKLCVALNFPEGGGLFVSTNPSSRAPLWKFVRPKPGGSLISMSCRTTTSCVGSDTSGDIVWSARPELGASAWHAVRLESNSHYLVSVSCSLASFCAAADDQGNILTSAHPRAAPVFGDP